MVRHITDEELLARVGGRFRLTALLQKRLLELSRGARKLVEVDSNDPMEIARYEIAEGLINLEVEGDKSSQTDDSKPST